MPRGIEELNECKVERPQVCEEHAQGRYKNGACQPRFCAIGGVRHVELDPFRKEHFSHSSTTESRISSEIMMYCSLRPQGDVSSV